MKKFLVIALVALAGCLDHGRETKQVVHRINPIDPTPPRPKPGLLMVTDGNGNLIDVLEGAIQDETKTVFVGDSLVRQVPTEER